MSFNTKFRPVHGPDETGRAITRGLGKTMKRWLQISGLVVALLGVAGVAQAAGLGRLSVQSVLGQPLRAEIELLSVTPDELGMVEAKLASPEAFRQARIERAENLANLRFSVEKRANGQPIVRIRSVNPVNDPFVDLLIELNWSSGRILREYTLLLDPTPEPMAQAEALLERVAPVTAAAPARPPVPEPGPLPAATPAAEPAPAGAAKRRATEKAKPAPVEETEGRETYGPVKGGETLRSIAAKVAPPNVGLEMMMAGLYTANQEAFLHDNMNLLKKGQVLAVPARDKLMQSTSPAQARQLIREHTAAWQARQARVADQAARAVETPASAASGRIVPAQPEAAAPAPAPGKDVLRLSKGEPGAKEREAGKRIESLETELAARGRALEEAQSRVSQLEKTVRDLQRLIELKGKETAKPAAVEAKPAAPAEAKPAAEKPTEPAKAESKEPTQPAAKPPALPVKEEPGLLSMILENPLYIGGVVAAVILFILLWVVMLGNRRRKGLSDFEQSIMTGGDQFKTSIFRTGSGSATRSGVTTQSGIATDFSRLGLGSIDTHEVDPIAEAEVYMAYGRDAQAEEILKEALVKDPARHEIALKLLEIYAAREDTASFETQASELYAGLGGEDSPVWHKAAEMGRKIDPDNPLYRVYGDAPSLPEAPEPAPASMEEPVSAPAEPVAEAAPPEPAPTPEPSLEPEPAADMDEQVIEFDLQEPFEPSAVEEPPAVEAAEPTAAAAAEVPMDFDLSELQPAVEEEPVAPRPVEALPSGRAAASAAEEAGLDLALPSDEEINLAEAVTQQVPLADADEAISLELPEEQAIDLEADLGDLADLEAALPGAKPASAEAAESSELAAPGKVRGSDDTAEVALPDLDFSGISLDLADAEAAPEAEETHAAPAVEAPEAIDPDLADEVNIKLDLAKAYLEMGDKEGAGEILNEVLKEGDVHQQEQARKLMADVA